MSIFHGISATAEATSFSLKIAETSPPEEISKQRTFIFGYCGTISEIPRITYMLRQKVGSVVCPSCRNLVGVNDERCYNCGRWNPGLWGFAPALSRLGRDLGFTQFVMWSCIILYLLTLAFDVQGVSTGGFNFL